MSTTVITNGSFDNTGSWTLRYGNGSSGVYIDTVHHYLVMDGLAWPVTQEADSNGFPTAAGVTYTVQFDLNEQSSGGGHSNTNFTMGLLLGSLSGPNAGNYNRFGQVTPVFDATWHTYSLTFVGTGDESTLEFNNAIGANRALVDNVSVIPNTPPVGMALLVDSGSSASDHITNNASILGLADPTSVVTIRNGGTTLATVTSDANGAWTYAPTFGDGSYTLTASETDSNSVTGTATLSFTLDTVPPAAPTAALAHDTGASSSDHITSNPALTGSAEAGDTITILNGGTTLDTVTANSSGTWSSSPTLSDGSYTLTINSADTAGNVATTTLSLTLDTNPPSPTVGLVSDTGVSSSDGLTSNPALTGTAEAHDVVTILNGGTTLGTATANASGAWSYTPTLADGSYTLTASEADVPGNVATNTVGFVLETVAQPVSMSLSNDTGASSSDRITSDPTVGGSAEANSSITIYNGSTVVAGTSADGSGSWNVTPTLADGNYTLTVAAVNEAGNTATSTLSFHLETVAPAVSAALAHDTGVSSSDGITSNPAMAGTAQAGSVISFINSDSTVLGSVTTNSSGSWSFTPTIADGSYSLTVSEETKAGNIATTTLNLTLDTTALSVSASLSDDNGDSSSDGITSDPALGGVTEADSAVVIRNGSTVLGTVNADDSGTWSFTPTLADGHHTLTVSASNLAGGAATTTLGFTLETTAPAVTVALLHDTGASSSDGVTSDSTLTGTAGPGSLVTIVDGDGVTYGSATAGVSGGWSVTPTLSDASYVLTAVEQTVAGNTATATISFTQDTTAPTVTAFIADDTGTIGDSITTDPTISGTGDSNTLVIIRHGATVLGTTSADGAGSWTFTLALPNGDYTLTASETDSAGNIGTATVEIILEGQVVPVTAVLTSDTGASSSDGITSNPAINGGAAADSVITIANGSTVLGTVTADSSGSWSFTPTLADGSYTLTTTEAVPGGGTGSSTLSFTLDTTAPTVSTALASDTGVSSSDGITSNPALTGIAEVGNIVTIRNGATLLGSTTAGASGSWSFTPTLADGSYTLTVTDADTAGNTASTTLAFTLDTTAPTVTAALVSDTGVSASDRITSNPALTGTAAAGGIVTIRNGATVLGTTTAGVSGSWSFTPTLVNGGYTLTASETDTSGNTGTATLAVTLETSAPTPIAALAHDTGVSSSDGITSNPALAGTAVAGSVMTIRNGGTVLGTTTAGVSGSWSFTPTLADGGYTLTASELTPAGNTASTTLVVILETTAPTPTAALAHDTGVSSSDGITSNPALTGTAEAGSVVTLRNGATVLGTTTTGVSGTWSFTPTLADGSYTLTASELTSAGNTATTTLAITLETTAPPVTVALSADTGVSSSDRITSSPTVRGSAGVGSVVTLSNGGTVLGTVTADNSGSWSFTPTLADGSYTLTASELTRVGNTGSNTLSFTLDSTAPIVTAALTSDTGVSASDGITSNPALNGTAAAGGVVTIRNGATVLGSTTAGASGTWSFTPTLGSGSYTLTASETDTAGNTGTATLAITLETSAPTPTAVLVSDTGVSSSDGITSNPALTGTAAAGSVVTIRNGATVSGTTTAGVSGAWSFTPTLADGSYTLTAAELTSAGNTASTTLAVTLETTAPTPTAVLAHDTGASSSDGITSNPALTGTAAAGSVVTIRNGATVLGTTTTGVSGTWSFTPTLATGGYTLTASELTSAGNTASTTLSLTLETSAPTPTAALVSDTGVSSSDRITSNAALIGTAAAGSVVTIRNGATVLGSTTAGVSGTWSFTPTLADGSYTLTASEVTPAGNTASTTLAITLETTAPTATAALVSDTGVSSSDHITSNAALTGTAAAGSVVTIRNGATVLGTTTAGVSGTWSFTPTLADGSTTLTASELTPAGNTASTTLAITLETTAPTPTVALVSDTGVSASDHITANAALTGTAGAGSVVTIRNGATVLGSTTTGLSGTWSFTPTLSDGGYTLTASELTSAGNTATTTLALTLEAAAPTPTAVLVSDTGVSASDGITSNPALTGTAAAGSVVTIRNGATVLGATTAGVSGVWSFTPTLADGSYTLTAAELTSAGNTASTTLAITLETTAPTPTAVLAHDTGASSSDGITSNPALTGTAAAGSVVTIRNGATVLGTTTTGVSGTWSFTPTLATGGYTLTASELTSAGNTASTTLSLTLETSAPTPTAALVSDTGVSSSDRITSNAALIGTAAAGSVVTIRNGATVLGSTTAGVSGTWSFTPTLVDGSYTLTAGELTPAGNTASTTLAIILEAAAPVPTAALVSDTGISSSDRVTSNPALTGTAAAGSVVTIRNGATVLGSTTAGVSGTWSFTPTLADGSTTLTVSELTPAGNTASTTLAITLETTAFTPTVALVSDTGVSASDRITSNPALTGTAAAGSVVTIRNGATVLGSTTAGVSGTWSFTPTLADGSATLTVSELTPAGNTASTTLAITLETTAFTPTVALVSDTGVSASDRITSNAALTGTAAAGSVLTIRNGATGLGSTTAGVSGTWSFTPTLAAGSYTLTAAELTSAGNTASTTLAITLETTAPTPTVALVSDTGASGSDRITSNATLTGTAAAGSVVTIRNGATVLGTTTAGISGTWSFTPTLADGGYILTASELTLAGNTASTTLAITLEAAAPTPTAALVSDTGVSVSDRITSNAALTGTAAAGSVMTIRNGATVLGSTTAGISGTWSFTPTLADGGYILTASELTLAGNTASTTLAITLEAAAPTPTAALVSDTGVSASDGVTSNPALTGTAAAGSVVTIRNGATVLGSTTAGVSGTWSFTPTLADGSTTLTASELTQAGNTASTTLVITLETSIATPAALTLAVGSDSGTHGDHITNITTPVIHGSGVAGDAITLYNGAVQIGAGTVGQNGTWSITSASLTAGSHSLNATQTDAAGNVSDPSTGLALTIDTTIPAVPTLLTLAPVSDSGITLDNITNITTPAITGSGTTGDTVSLYDGSDLLGMVVVGGDGTWSVTTGTLADGDHTFTATATDVAGNTSAGSDPLVVTIDTTAPVTPTLGESAATTDPAAPVIDGSAESGSTVQIYQNGTAIGTTTAEADAWNYSYGTALAAGTYVLTATATDDAGNVSEVSAPLTLRVNSDNSYAVVTPIANTDTTKLYVYDAAGVLTTVQTANAQQQTLTSVTNTAALINIYDSAGTLIGTIAQPSTSAFSQPIFATTPNTLAASTGSGPIGSVVNLLGETNNFVSQGNDTITVHAGSATITATGPSTVVNNISANVTFYGGTGTASVYGGSGSVTAVGGAGGGTLMGGTAGNNVLAAGGGTTMVIGVADGDMLYGSNTGTDTLQAGAGVETLVGGAGTETLNANTGDAAFGGSGNSTLNGGTNGGSTLVGGSGTSTLVADGGSESMWGGSGQSTLHGGSGQDIMGGSADINSSTLMIGGTGDAVFLGYAGTVNAIGGSGNDTFWTGTGAMTITEGAGNDTVVFGSGQAVVTGGAGFDIYTFINGFAGGSDTISNFKVGLDQIHLFGYDAGAAQPQVIGGNTVLSFADHTSVTLLGVIQLAANSIVQ